MRSLITASVVFALTISICIACYYVATSFSTDMNNDMELIEDTLKNEDFEAAQKYAEQCLNRLEDSDFLLAAIANHQEISNIKNGLLKLNQHLKDGDKDGATISVIEMTALFNRFYNSERLTFENVF